MTKDELKQAFSEGARVKALVLGEWIPVTQVKQIDVYHCELGDEFWALKKAHAAGAKIEFYSESFRGWFGVELPLWETGVEYRLADNHFWLKKAHAEGKQIQYRYMGGGSWYDAVRPGWLPDYEYRVKPEASTAAATRHVSEELTLSRLRKEINDWRRTYVEGCIKLETGKNEHILKHFNVNTSKMRSSLVNDPKSFSTNPWDVSFAHAEAWRRTTNATKRKFSPSWCGVDLAAPDANKATPDANKATFARATTGNPPTGVTPPRFTAKLQDTLVQSQPTTPQEMRAWLRTEGELVGARPRDARFC